MKDKKECNLFLYKYKSVIYLIFTFLTVFNIQSQEVDDVTSATTTLFTRFAKHSYEYGTEKALMRSDLEIVVKSIHRVFRKNYPFGFPVKDVPGDVNRGYDRESHTGYDITADLGTEIIATGAGKVIQIEYLPETYGNVVIIKHDNGFYTMYGGLDSVLVKKDQLVKAKESIGLVGNSKHVLNPSVHYGIFHAKEWDPSLKKSSLSYISINPYEFIHN